MATVVLTAVGTVLGGPIGAAIGALAGQAIDARLFAPKARHGPRLGELAVQTSSYGTAIPRIFGTMRVAGTVIWSTDLQEHRSTSGGGKGRPKSVNYTYSASFAVALSGRPIRTVRRIWADGKLLRGAAGDFKSPTDYRLYLGEEDQSADPLIVAAEGISGTPAYRGLAYAMFEDMQLADFGNRIPSLTFEVEADAGPVPIGQIAEELSEHLVRSGATPELAGYAAGGDSVRGAIEDLAGVFPLRLIEQDGEFRLEEEAGEPVLVPADEIGAHGGQPERGRTQTERRRDAPSEVGITYYEPERDYQTGLQRAVASHSGRGVGRAERLSLAAALPADRAKALAEARLVRHEAERTSAEIHLSWRNASIRPGALLTLDALNGRWRVARWALEDMQIRLTLVRAIGTASSSSPASAGRPISQPDLIHGPTRLCLADLPLFAETAAQRPRLLVAAAGAQAGWRSAGLTVSYDGGASWQSVGASAAPAVLGTASGTLSPSGAALFDSAGEVEVELLNPAMLLESRIDAALIAGANLALLGAELVQFGRALQVGPQRYRLSRLLRGRFGTEWAVAGHEPGETFLLIEPESLVAIEPSAALVGGEARVLATGLGDGEDGVLASCLLTGEALRPPSPVHLRAQRDGSGGLAIRWVRRSRTGWRWLDETDAPLGEETERYRLSLAGGSGAARVVDISTPAFFYGPELQAADGASGPISIEVVQLGTFASSRPARLIAA